MTTTTQTAIGRVIVLFDHEVESAWDWITGKAQAAYNALEPLFAPLLKAFEGNVYQSLWKAAAALLVKLTGVTDLATLEAALLNVLSALGGNLLSAAEALGSVAIQTLLGVVQLHTTIPAVAEPVAAAA